MKIIAADHSGAVRTFDAVVSREGAELFAKSIKSAYDSYWKLTGDVGNRKVKYNEPAKEFLECELDKSFNDFLRGEHEMDCHWGGGFVDHKYSIKPTDRSNYSVHAKWDPQDKFEIFADEEYD